MTAVTGCLLLGPLLAPRHSIVASFSRRCAVSKIRKDKSTRFRFDHGVPEEGYLIIRCARAEDAAESGEYVKIETNRYEEKGSWAAAGSGGFTFERSGFKNFRDFVLDGVAYVFTYSEYVCSCRKRYLRGFSVCSPECRGVFGEAVANRVAVSPRVYLFSASNYPL